MSKTILILGAGSDIAQMTAHQFASNGFDLLLAARNSERLASHAKDLEIRHKTRVTLMDFDAAKIDSHESFYSTLPVSPDVVLYAIGYLGDQKKAEFDADERDKVMSANLTGAISILSLVANDFAKRGDGTIIGISSVAGERGRKSNYFYGAAKAGFTAFLSGLRHRLHGSGVSVLTVKPGFVATKMTEGMNLPKRLTATPEALSRAIFRAYTSQKHTLFYPPIWRCIMFLIRNIPERIFVKTKV